MPSLLSFWGACLVNKPHSHISSILQKESESLKSYVQRFNEAMMEIEGGSDDQAIQAMQNGLRENDFIRTIAKNLPQTFLERLMEAHKHISVEKILESRMNLNKKVSLVRS